MSEEKIIQIFPLKYKFGWISLFFTNDKKEALEVSVRIEDILCVLSHTVGETVICRVYFKNEYLIELIKRNDFLPYNSKKELDYAIGCASVKEGHEEEDFFQEIIEYKEEGLNEI